MALLMMLMTFASCSKLRDLLNEGDDDDDDDGGINPPELVEGRMEDIALSGIVRCQRHSNRGREHRERLFCCYYQYRRIL